MVTIAAAFFVADIVIFDAERIQDAAYTKGEDAYVRCESVELWNRRTLTELPAVGKPGKM